MLSFRNTASYGKRIEYFVISQMLREGLDCYIPLVDDDGIDVIVKTSDKNFSMVQIKARSKNVKEGNSALFAGIEHKQRENYFFVFYSERLQKDSEPPFYWIFSSKEFVEMSRTNRAGKHSGKKTLKLNCSKKGVESINEKYRAFVHNDFSKLLWEG